MRDAVFIAVMLGLLPIAVWRPFAGVLLWCWISFMNPHRLLYGVAMELPWAAAIFAATLLGCVLTGEIRKARADTLTLLLMALLVCITVTSLNALGDPDAVWAKYDGVAKVILGLIVTGALLTDRWRIHGLVWAMVISIGYYGVRGGIFAIMTGGNYRVFGPAQTMITDNNHLAAAMLVTLPLMNYLRLQSRHRAVRIGLSVAMGLTLLAVVSSYSRGALLGLGAVVVVMWIRSRSKVLLAAVLAVVLTGAVTFMPPQWSERMNSIGEYQEDGSATERLVLWGISWKLAVSRPMLGSGFTGPYNREVVDRVEPGGPARAVHSIWFELLGEQGFVTFFVWLSMTLIGAFWTQRLIWLSRGRPDLAWAGDFARMAQVSMVAYLVSGTFLSLSYWDFYWTLLVAIGGAWGMARRAAVPAAVAQASAPARAGWRTA
ncbi:MAG: putative O-glycosylation ligase, exosortase system type 1-associated [Rubritepida sp.]|nr:putative O-glycosylation ligase, exosortase system type 1-associated [Rubritepida sp.]